MDKWAQQRHASLEEPLADSSAGGWWRCEEWRIAGLCGYPEHSAKKCWRGDARRCRRKEGSLAEYMGKDVGGSGLEEFRGWVCEVEVEKITG